MRPWERSAAPSLQHPARVTLLPGSILQSASSLLRLQFLQNAECCLVDKTEVSTEFGGFSPFTRDGDFFPDKIKFKREYENYEVFK